MAFCFTIGKATIEVEHNEAAYGEGLPLTVLRPTVTPCEGNVWKDEWGGDDATRSPSYGQWASVLNKLPLLKATFEMMHAYTEYWGVRAFIPCSIYADRLSDLEREAHACPDKAVASREFWFVHWSREAISRYGELAAFEVPGEWC